jgi:hypothetical protein
MYVGTEEDLHQGAKNSGCDISATYLHTTLIRRALHQWKISSEYACEIREYARFATMTVRSCTCSYV